MKITKRVKVSDDWFPTSLDGTITISLIIDNYEGYHVRMVAFGEDDYGLEKNYISTSNLEVAKTKFKEVEKDVYNKIPIITNKAYYKDLGFISW